MTRLSVVHRQSNFGALIYVYLIIIQVARPIIKRESYITGY